MKLIHITTNLTKVQFNKYIIWFSYEEPIAFKTIGGKIAVTKNIWSNTTSKHINYIKSCYPDAIQCDHTKFIKLLSSLSI